MSGNVEQIKSKIRQRRSQMLIHSCIYYEMDSNVVSDHKWQEWAEELHKLQTENPNCCKIGFFDFEFRDWDGTTGNHLPLKDPWVWEKAKWLLNYHSKQQ